MAAFETSHAEIASINARLIADPMVRAGEDCIVFSVLSHGFIRTIALIPEYLFYFGANQLPKGWLAIACQI